MICDKCLRFPAPTSTFVEVATSTMRQGTLYKCKYCGKYYEVLELSRGVFTLTEDEIKKYYDVG